MLIQEILARKGHDVVTIAPDRTIAHAVRLLVEHGIGSVVVTEGDEILGILTERDVLRQVDRDAQAIEKLEVRELMETKLIVGVPDDDVGYVMEIMTTNRIRHLPVVNNGSLVGMVSIGDIVNALRTSVESENRYLREYVQGNVR
jgi:CBS domain-containing protein